jgi:hypothetical protein
VTKLEQGLALIAEWLDTHGVKPADTALFLETLDDRACHHLRQSFQIEQHKAGKRPPPIYASPIETTVRVYGLRFTIEPRKPLRWS